MSKENMGIEDAEFTDSAKKLKSYAKKLDKKFETYIQSINKICEEAIQDQLICSKLTTLCEQVEALRSPLNEYVEQAASDCKKFVKEIDKADQFLY